MLFRSVTRHVWRSLQSFMCTERSVLNAFASATVRLLVAVVVVRVCRVTSRGLGLDAADKGAWCQCTMLRSLTLPPPSHTLLCSVLASLGTAASFERVYSSRLYRAVCKVKQVSRQRLVFARPPFGPRPLRHPSLCITPESVRLGHCTTCR